MSGQLYRLDLMQHWKTLCCKKQSDANVWAVCWYVYQYEDDGNIVDV